MLRKLKRIDAEGKIGGVCAGLAYWLGIPTWLMRLAWAVAFFIYGVGLVAYVLLCIFMPVWEETPKDYEEIAD